MKYLISSVLVASRPTLLRARWPRSQFTLTAAVGQVLELAAHRPFDLLVLDEALPGRALPELLARLPRQRPTQRIALLLSTSSCKKLATAPLAWPDTRLLLPHHVALPELVKALAPWLDPAAETTAPARPGAFSARKLEVLHLVGADCCNQEIANRLCVSVRTAESHRCTLLHKTGAHSSAGLAVQAVREGWWAKNQC